MRFRPSTAAQQSQYGEPITLAILGVVSAGAGLFGAFKNKRTAEITSVSQAQQMQAALYMQQQQAIEDEKKAARRMALLKWGTVAVVGGAITIFTVRSLLSNED
jgi:hypothetical protein